MPTTAPPIEGASGEAEVFESPDGFRVTLPSQWVTLDVSADDVDSALGDVYDTLNPETVEAMRNAFASGIEFSLYAIDYTGDPNVNVLVVPRSPLDTVENLQKLLPTQLAEMFDATVLSAEAVEYGGLEGVEIVYEAEFPAGDAEGHQYYLLDEEVVFVFTFTTFDPESDRAEFQRVMESFQTTT